MTDNGKYWTTIASLGLSILVLIVTVIVFGVNLDARSMQNQDKIYRVEGRVENVEGRVNAHDVQLANYNRMEKRVEKTEQNTTDILVMLKRLETKIENLEK